MWKAVKAAIIGILSSKKAVLGLTTALTAGLLKLGLDVDSETVGLVVAPLVAAIVGQGIADHGKEAAKAETPAS
jgi:hypothetical protein